MNTDKKALIIAYLGVLLLSIFGFYTEYKYGIPFEIIR
jgi:hypothetical protein